MTTAASAAEPCDSLTPESFARLTNLSAEARLVQQTVHDAYRRVDEGEAEKRLLSDGYIGQFTVEVLRRFCNDLGLPPGKDPIGELLAAVRALAAIEAAHPDWQAIIATAAFQDWASTLSPGLYGGYYRLSADGPRAPVSAFLIDAYPGVDRPPPAGDFLGLHVLTAADLELLAAGAEAGVALEGVSNQDFPSPGALRQAVQAALGVSNEPIDELVENIVAAAMVRQRFRLREGASVRLGAAGVPAELVDQVAEASRLDFASRDDADKAVGTMIENLSARYEARVADLLASAGQDSGAAQTPAQFRDRLRGAGLPEQLVEKIESTAGTTVRAAVTQAMDGWQRQIQAEIEPYAVYKLAPQSLADPLLQALANPVLATMAGKLTPLQDIRFPDGYLLRKALRYYTGATMGDPTADAAENANRAELTILALARKRGWSDLKLTPVNWSGSPCGCSPFEEIDAEYPSYLYGLYPYWAASQETDEKGISEPQEIDFSVLNRVGYYGLTFDRRGVIAEPLHWRQAAYPEDAVFWQQRNFADFINRAHQYKAQVDAVVYNSRWSGWLTDDAGSDDLARSEDGDTGVAATLIESLAGLVTPTIRSFRNYLKPVISLRASPARTLGDGVTLDFDFSTLSRSDQRRLFQGQLGPAFFKRLNIALNGTAEKTGNNRGPFFVNLMVPAQCIAEAQDQAASAHCEYFRLQNLKQLVPYLNLMVVDMTDLAAGDDIVGVMKRIRSNVEALEDIDLHIDTLEKLVPLMVVHPDSPITHDMRDGFTYSDWYFSGMGSWPLPLGKDQREALRAAFLPDDGSGDGGLLASAEARVCNFLCPQRWPLRMLISAIVVASLAYGIACIWYFDLRRWYSRRYFRLAVALAALVLFATLWCDPYWSRKQAMLLIPALAALLVAWLVFQRTRSMERDYP